MHQDNPTLRALIELYEGFHTPDDIRARFDYQVKAGMDLRLSKQEAEARADRFIRRAASEGRFEGLKR